MLRKASAFYLALFFCLLSPAAVLAAPPDNTVAQLRRAADTIQDEDEESSPYIVGSQNLLQIKIFGEASVNQLYRVDEDGFIKHALAGRVKLGGLTVTEAEQLMEQRLDGDYIINPQVSIFVLEFSHFSIIGEVRKPGNYEISGRTSVLRAISIAGGFTPVANQKGVQIIRKTADGSETKLSVDATRIMNGDMSGDVEMQAEDVVVVTKSFF